MITLPRVDVVFVGFGLVGGVIANELSKQATGLRMVALERGPFRMTNPDFVADHFDEWRFALQGELFQDASRETVTFRNDVRQVARPIREWGAFRPGNGVGGAMVHWNGQLWRFLPHHFRYRSHLEERYGKGFLPPDTTIRDWPLSYDDLEPHYAKFDRTFGISGRAGNLKGVIQTGGNPFEGQRSEEFPQAPGPIGYGPTLFKEAAERLGYSPFPQPSGNSPGTYRNPDGQVLAPCNYCGFCERFGCHAGAKASPITTVIPSALASGRVEVRPYSNVFRIDRRDGHVSGVSYYDGDGEEVRQPADLVVLGAWTLGNVRLLLLSGIGRPYDPSTGTGAVGRNWTYQVFGASATGWYDDRILNRFMGAGANGYAIDDLNGDNFDHKDLGFFGGGSIACNSTGARPIESHGPLPPGTPRWGSAWKAAVRQHYNRSVSFGMQGESPAYRQNYVDLDPTYRDAWGHPLLRMTFNFTDNERRMVRHVANAALRPILDQMGPAIRHVNDTIDDFDVVPYQSTHLNGGTIIGADPETSVVNKYCQVWDVPSLFVVGASNFPQNPGYNPTGTVGALAFHVAHALIDRYLKSPGMLA